MASLFSALLSKSGLPSRLRQVRTALYGEHGGPEMARLLGIPPQTWANYEDGVAVSGPILLLFIVTTDAEPRWLLTGEGARFQSSRGDETPESSNAEADF